MSIKISVIVPYLMVALFVVSPAFVAAETATPLPPAARVAFDKGMVAVEQKEWPTAIRYFLKAQEVEPYAPEVLFNLGLAESKVPGRELRAIVWFRAYLAKTPNAPNAVAVRKEITGLEIRVEATIDRLIKQAKQLVAQESDHRNEDYGALGVAIAKTGDIPGAKQTALKAAGGFFYANDALSEIAAIQYHAGDAAGAEATILDIGSGERYGRNEIEYSAQSRAYGYIAHLQAIKGDFSGAEATIGRAQLNRDKGFYYLNVAMEEALAGKRDQALSMVAKAMHACGLDAACRESTSLWMIQDRGWEIQSYLGDTEAAKKTFALYKAKVKNPYARFDPAVDRKHIEDAATGKDLGLVGFRKELDFIGDERLLVVAPREAAPSEKHVECVRLLKEKLGDELFTDQESAIRTIANNTRPREIVSGMLKAIENITNRLKEARALGT
jgi:tetratricopeptide (TPR) repeat protein